MIAIANNKNGKDENTWMIKEITASTFPPKYPAHTPIVYPITVAIICETTPTLKEIRQPYTILEKISRPKSSVPNQCWALGGIKRSVKTWASGSYGAIHGANKATKHKIITIPKQAIATLFFLNIFQLIDQ